MSDPSSPSEPDRPVEPDPDRPAPGSVPPPPPPGYQVPGHGAPGPGYGAPGPQPNNYLVWAILTTILCCLPLGVVSIVYAAQVGSKYGQGDYAGAVRSSENARKWAIASAVVGLAVAVIYVVIVVLVVANDNAAL